MAHGIAKQGENTSEIVISWVFIRYGINVDYKRSRFSSIEQPSWPVKPVERNQSFFWRSTFYYAGHTKPSPRVSSDVVLDICCAVGRRLHRPKPVNTFGYGFIRLRGGQQFCFVLTNVFVCS